MTGSMPVIFFGCIAIGRSFSRRAIVNFNYAAGYKMKYISSL